MKSELKEQILDLRDGDHLCLFYEKDPAEQMPALVPFVSERLLKDKPDRITGNKFWFELVSAN